MKSRVKISRRIANAVAAVILAVTSVFSVAGVSTVKAAENEKKFVVTFNYETKKGEVSISKEVSKGEKVSLPSSNYHTYGQDGDAITRTRHYIKDWTAAGEYDKTDLESVSQDMTFTATMGTVDTAVKYFVLNYGKDVPSELSCYPIVDYSEVGVLGGLQQFKCIANNLEAVEDNLANIPDISLFTVRDADGKPYAIKDTQYIQWYVIKLVNQDEYHVDGVIKDKPSVTYYYVDEAGKTIKESNVVYYEKTDINTTKAVVYPEIAGYKKDENKLVESVNVIDGNTEVTLVYDTVIYNVTYIVDGVQYGETETVKEGTEVTTLKNKNYSAKTGYKFSGWSTTFEGDKVNANIVLVGTTSISEEETHDITYTINYYKDGVKEETIPVKTNVWINKTEVDVDSSKINTKDKYVGYTFDEKTTGTIPTVAKDGDEINIYYNVIKYNVTYYIDGKQYGKTDTVEYGASVNNLLNKSFIVPTGYKFSGWSTEFLGEKVTQDITVVGTTSINELATHYITYTVNYFKDGELEETTPVKENVWINTTEVEVNSRYINTKDKFLGYVFDAKTTGIIPTVVKDGDTINIYYNIIKYNVVYIVDSIQYGDSEVVKYGTLVSKLKSKTYTTPVGVTFSGWSTTFEGEFVNADITLIGTTSEVGADEDVIPEPEPKPTPAPTPAPIPEVAADEDEIPVPEVASDESVVKTGDSHNMVLYGSLLALATLAGVATVVVKKREEN